MLKDPIEIDIADLAYGGDGVGRLADGRACFVPFALPGERVRVRLVQEASRYARAACLEVLAPSPDRVPPTCPHAGACGGCHYQHLAYPVQLRWKHKQVVDVLARIGGLRDAVVEPIVAGPKPFGYRNKITLHGPGRPAFLDLDGHTRIPIARCPLAHDALNAALATDERHALGPDENLVLRCNAAGEVRGYTERHGRIIARANDNGATATPAPLTEHLKGLDIEYPATSFFQVNPALLELVLGELDARFATYGCDTLVDAYCGVGVFALTLARRVQRGIGIETDPAAVAAATANARQLSAGHLEFIRGSTDHRLDRVLQAGPAARTCLILDPPRAGCSDAALCAVTRNRPRRVLYVSCVPPILARDLKRLTAAGYRLTRLRPFDMFPQTVHIECLAELEWA